MRRIYSYSILTILIATSLFFISSKSMIEVTGIVYDDSNSPLIGVNIIEKVGVGEEIITSTITNIDGKFTISVKSSSSVLQFSYLGFKTKQIDLAKKDLSKPIVVKLSGDSNLDEVVITSYKVPLIDFDQTTSGNTVTAESIMTSPLKNGKPISKKVIGLASYSDGKTSVRGSRTNPTNYYVDGLKVSSAGLIPANKEFETREEKKFKRENPKMYAEFHDEEVNVEAGNYTSIVENPFYSPTKDPLSTLSIDVDRASYSNVRRFLQQGTMPPADAVRVEEMVNYFNYDYKAPSINAKRPFNTEIELTSCPWNQDHQLMHVALQGAQLDRDNIPPSNFVFLIDVSGSMNHANKLPLLKSSLKLLVNQLTEKDRVAIVVYAGAAGCVLESTPGSDKAKILNSLNALHSGGSTAGAAGIQQAYKIAKKNFIKGGNNRILLATDGDFNVGTSGDKALVELIELKRKEGVFLSIMGFGIGNYQDGKMQKIADAGNGNHSYIDNMKEAKKVLMDEFGGTMFTIAKDVKIQIEFNPAVVEGYRMVGYENRVLAAEDFNDDTKDAGEMGAGHTVTVLYEIIPVGSKSAFAKSIDDLKYQKNKSIKRGPTHELATIKYRFKKPDANRSTKTEEIIKNEITKWNKVDEDVKWAAYVAEFGLLLRKSQYIVDGNYDHLITGIKSSINNKSGKYRDEFLDLVEIAKGMDVQYLTAEKE